jgi:hypothetical protein
VVDEHDRSYRDNQAILETIQSGIEDDAQWAMKFAERITVAEAERTAIIIGAMLTLALGRNAYAFWPNTQRGHTAEQKGYKQMDDERVAAILGRYQDETMQFDPAVVEGVLTHGPVDERQELAGALAYVWRRDVDKPVFVQPPEAIVHEVENIIGEHVWAEAAEHTV